MAGVWKEALKEEFRTKLGSLWCSLKHLVIRLECHLQSGYMEKAKELSKKVKELYEVRRSVRNFIKMPLFNIFKKLGSAPQIRCRREPMYLGVKHALQGPKGVFKKD